MLESTILIHIICIATALSVGNPSISEYLSFFLFLEDVDV